MSNDQEDKNKEPEEGGAEGQKGHKAFLNYLKDNKSSKISVWIGKSSEMYNEIKQFRGDLAAQPSGGIVAPDDAVAKGALVKAIEIARLEWVKAKLESEDPVELTDKYNTRMARMNDEYHHKNILFSAISVVGFMKDKDSNQDRLLITKDQDDARNQVFAVDPTTGAVLEVFDITSQNCLIALRRST